MPDDSLRQSEPQSLFDALRQRTTARLLAGRAGTSYRTVTQLGLRLDHAAAIDAVRRELDPLAEFDSAFTTGRSIVCVSSAARTKEEYLLRPDLGRILDGPSQALIRDARPTGVDIQFAIGDGLSAAAVLRQAPMLLPLLESSATAAGWSIGPTLFIRHARVGIINHLGDLVSPRVVVLLIGERPGLATDDSMSAYMAYRPRSGQTDADRNLISNIHDAGVPTAAAAPRIIALCRRMFAAQASGTAIKESLPELAVIPKRLPNSLSS